MSVSEKKGCHLTLTVRKDNRQTWWSQKSQVFPNTLGLYMIGVKGKTWSSFVQSTEERNNTFLFIRHACLSQWKWSVSLKSQNIQFMLFQSKSQLIFFNLTNQTANKQMPIQFLLSHPLSKVPRPITSQKGTPKQSQERLLNKFMDQQSMFYITDICYINVVDPLGCLDEYSHFCCCCFNNCCVQPFFSFVFWWGVPTSCSVLHFLYDLSST